MIETRTLWVSLVALKTRCVTRVDLRLRDSRCRSPKCDVEYCLPACTHLGQDPTGNHIFGAQSRSGFDSQSIPFTLATFLFTLQATTSANGAYTPPAKLDTGRVANTYPGGSHTRWSSNHFQSARACDGSPRHFDQQSGDVAELNEVIRYQGNSRQAISACGKGSTID